MFRRYDLYLCDVCVERKLIISRVLLHAVFAILVDTSPPIKYSGLAYLLSRTFSPRLEEATGGPRPRRVEFFNYSKILLYTSYRARSTHTRGPTCSISPGVRPGSCELMDSSANEPYIIYYYVHANGLLFELEN